MKLSFFGLIAAAALAGTVLPASAQTNAPQTNAPQTSTFSVFNTGVGTDGAVLPSGTLGDPHYTLVSSPAGGSSQIQVLTSAFGFPIVSGAWLGDSSSSAWIAPSNSPFLNAGYGGDYDYQTTFDLTGFDPATASLSGGWATDNTGTAILLNGVSVGAAASQSYSAYTPFTITGGFHTGLNTLDFLMNDDGQGGTGLRVDGLVGTAGPAAVPEASTTVSLGLLLALGLGGIVAARRKTVQA